MKQLAGDGVYRIFQALAEQVEIPASRILDRNTLIKCLLSGKSESKWLKEVKKIKTGLGHEVKTLQNGEEKVFFTGQIYEKSCCLWKNEIGVYVSKESVSKSQKYSFRHSFDFETSNCTKSLDLDDPELQKFQKADKYDELLKTREDVVTELFNKFISKDKKVMSALKIVLEEHFLSMDEKIDSLEEKVESGQGEILKNQHELKHNQNKILDEIQQLKLSIPPANVATIALGNPGSGKSTVLNSLAGECFFRSGLSFGKGLTSELCEGKNKLGIFLDTPGMVFQCEDF